MATSFFGGAFYNGEFFFGADQAQPAPVARSGGGGIQPKRRKTLHLPYKPTGLGGYRKKDTKEEALEETLAEQHEDAAEIAARLSAEFTEENRSRETEARIAIAKAETAIELMSQAQISSEISRLLKQQMRTEAEDVELLLLLAEIV